MTTIRGEEMSVVGLDSFTCSTIARQGRIIGSMMTDARFLMLVGLVLVAAPLAGCSEGPGAREVPVLKRGTSESFIDPKAPTRPPSGIATH